MARVAVVGAGLGGLAAAARLHAAGHQVTVYERSPSVGGKLATYSRDGFRFDTGPSLLTLPQLFAELYAATGDPLEKTLDLERVDPHCHYRFTGGTDLSVPAGRAALTEELTRALGATAARQWDGVLTRARQMWEVSRGPFLEAPGPPALLPLARRQPAQLRVIAPGRSLRWLARHLLEDARLQTLLERYATYSGSDPRRAPAALASAAYVEQEYGAWYVRGGLHQIATSLADRLPPGSVRTSTPVAGLDVRGGRVSGVRLPGGTLERADVVVTDVDASHLYGELLPRPRLIPRAEPSSAGFVLLLGLRRRPPALGHHTVLFPPLEGDGYAAEFDAIFKGRVAEQPTIYLSAPDDPATAPPGAVALFVLVNAPRQGPVDWDAPGFAAAYARRLLGLLAERGLDVRPDLAFCEIPNPGRSGPRCERPRRRDLRHGEPRTESRIPAAREPLTRPRSVPHRRQRPSRRRASAGNDVRPRRRRAHRPRLNASRTRRWRTLVALVGGGLVELSRVLVKGVHPLRLNAVHAGPHGRRTGIARPRRSPARKGPRHLPGRSPLAQPETLQRLPALQR